MTDLIVVTGSKGSGKTIAAATFAPPSEADKVFVIDTENSMSDVVKYIEFGKYVRAYERFKLDSTMLTDVAQGKLPWVTQKQKGQLAQYYQWFIEMLDKELTPNKFKYLVIDTIEPIEAAIAGAVEADGKQFGWNGSKAFGKLEVEGIRPIYEGVLTAIYARGVEHIIFTSHLHQPWDGDKPIANKVKPGGRLTLLTRLSTLMLWMVPNVGNEDGAPAALVLKARMGKMTATPEGWKTRRILPQRIPHFSWIDVDGYKKEPANFTAPAPGETPTANEQEMISEMLTNEQMRLMVAGAEIQLKQMQDSPMLTKPTVSTEAIIALANTGLPPMEVAQQLGVPLPIVLSAIKTIS